MEKLGKSNGMKRLGAVLLVCFIGAPVAAVPVLGQISYRPLTIGHSIKVAKAFGEDDEDCVYVTRRVPRPNGLTHAKKTLLCND
jgi:hypothetical protein